MQYTLADFVIFFLRKDKIGAAVKTNEKLRVIYEIAVCKDTE